MSEVLILQEFKNNLISFFDELIDLFPTEPDLVIIRIFLKDQIPIEEVINIFNNTINMDNQKFRKMIKDRNELFFLESNIFDSISKTKVVHFKKLWRSDQLDDDNKDVIWKWIDSFVYLGEKYAKVKSQ
jgi:hypothetical protein